MKYYRSSRYSTKTGATGVVSTTEFRPPCLVKIISDYEDGARFTLVLYATPTKPGFCRHIGTQLLIANENKKYPPGLGIYALPMPAWLLHPLGTLFMVRVDNNIGLCNDVLYV